MVAGVVQGSVLGPTLFLLFIADINDYVDDLIQLIKFADDLLIYTIFKDISEDNIQQAVDAIVEWAKINKMKLNESKTKHMLVNQKQQGPQMVTLNGQPLQEAVVYKYLGLHLNRNLTVHDHWATLTKKLRSNLFLYKQSKRLNFEKTAIVTAYKSLTLSVVEYAAPILTSAPQSIKTELERFHKRFLNIINSNPIEALNRYSLNPIIEHIDLRCEVILQQVLQDQNHPTTIKLTKSINPEWTIKTRSSFAYESVKANTERFNNSFVPKTLRALRDKSSIPLTQEAPPINTDNLAIVPTETPSDQWRCNECDMPFSSNKALMMHLRMASVHKPTPTTHPTTPDNTQNNWACDICGKILPTKAGIPIHIGRMHKNLKQ